MLLAQKIKKKRYFERKIIFKNNKMLKPAQPQPPPADLCFYLFLSSPLAFGDKALEAIFQSP